jgi:hypothetical protein
MDPDPNQIEREDPDQEGPKTLTAGLNKFSYENTLGAKRLNSLSQLGMVERGATTRKGPEIPISYRWQNRAAQPSLHEVMLQRLRVIKE